MTKAGSARAARASAPPRSRGRSRRDPIQRTARAVALIQRAAASTVAAALTACSPGTVSDATRADAAAPPGDAAPGSADARPSPATADAAPPDASSPWRLTFSDEFDGPVDAPPDAARWTPETGGHGWGNDELQFHTERTENASLDGAGNLRIVARREAFGGRDYTSARLVSRGHFEQAYGRFEARVRLPTGRGVWPAFWMLGADIDRVGWPECGEIDILEHKGQEPRLLYGSLHGPGYSGSASLTGTHVASADLPARFHVYAVEWTPERIAWSIDGLTYYAQTASEVAARGRWVYDHPFFLILNVAVGGNFVGPPDDSVFPQTMLVDYVRAYERVP